MLRVLFRVCKKMMYALRMMRIKTNWFLHYGNLGCSLSGALRIESNVDFFFRKQGKISIEGNTLICKGSKIVIDGGNLKVKDGCTFGAYNVFNVFDNVVIGENVLTADRVSFISNIHNYKNVNVPISQNGGSSASIEVGEGSWFGINSVVLPGTKIGRGCVVAANCVVKGEFPDYCVIAGVPGKIIKKYEKSNWNRV